jgi:Flp pilus assembly pilin Flp
MTTTSGTRRSLAERLRSDSGQTTNEYLMIAGLMTAIAIIVLGSWYASTQGLFQKIANCVLNDNC